MLKITVDALTANLGSSANVVFRTSGDSEIATMAMAATPFQTASSRRSTMNAVTADTDATGGTVAYCCFETGGAVEIWRSNVGSVGSGEDVETDNLTISAGSTVTLSSYILGDQA